MSIIDGSLPLFKPATFLCMDGRADAWRMVCRMIGPEEMSFAVTGLFWYDDSCRIKEGTCDAGDTRDGAGNC